MRKELAIRHQRIIALEESERNLQGTLSERENKIQALEHEISDLKDRIKQLESELFDATQSGDAAMNELREQLRKTQ